MRATKGAQVGAAALGFDINGMLEVVQLLTKADFFKSMTTHEDHRVWQDVYRPTHARWRRLPEADLH